VNSRLHEEFVALSALFYSGEIIEEEWALLQVHLAYCDVCRKTFEQYREISKIVVPEMAAAAAEAADMPRESESSLLDAERRLMEKIHISAKQLRHTGEVRQTWSKTVGVLAAMFILFAVLAYWSLNQTVHKRETTTSISSPASPTAVRTQPADQSFRAESKTGQQEILTLREKIAALEGSTSQLNPAVATLQRRIQAEETESRQVALEKEAATKHLEATETELQNLHLKLSSAESARDEQSRRAANLESNIRTLNISLEETNVALSDRDKMLSLDKDFLSHDRDIRDLIGARDLYIADIYDTNEKGKTAKPFGRLFYTRDRSLVLYGFDLDKQPGQKEAAAFQAWGTGDDQKPVSLGLFYQDENNKRWVVRFNDAKTLAHLNTVFVTVEPPGGSNKPTGQRLLYALLQLQGNHP
jgi:hypothetical protein